MRSGKKTFFGCLLPAMAMLLCPCSGAAETADSLTMAKENAVCAIVNVTGGYSQQLVTVPLPIGELSNGGLQGLVRIVLTRSRLIAIGVESGFLRMSSMRLRGIVKREIDAWLNAIPLFVVLGVQYFGIDAHVGLGYVDVISTSTVNGITVTSNTWEMGMSVALGYTREVSPVLSLGGEVRWMGLFDFGKSFLSAGIRAQIIAFEL